MKGTITIPIETLKCLRGHLDQINKALIGLNIDLGGEQPPKICKKPKKDSSKIKAYIKMLESGKRVLKPEHLKKSLIQKK